MVLVVNTGSVYSSVAAELTVVLPPNAKPAVCVPQPPKYFLAVLKDVLAVQAEPSYSSVFATLTVVYPPNPNPDVCVPAPA